MAKLIFDLNDEDDKRDVERIRRGNKDNDFIMKYYEYLCSLASDDSVPPSVLTKLLEKWTSTAHEVGYKR